MTTKGANRQRLHVNLITLPFGANVKARNIISLVCKLVRKKNCQIPPAKTGSFDFNSNLSHQ